MLQFKVNLYFIVLVPLISFAEFTKIYMYHLNYKTYISGFTQGYSGQTGGFCLTRFYQRFYIILETGTTV